MQNLKPIKITGWCRCLANLWAKRNLYFIIYFLPHPPLFKKRFRATVSESTSSQVKLVFNPFFPVIELRCCYRGLSYTSLYFCYAFIGAL